MYPGGGAPSGSALPPVPRTGSRGSLPLRKLRAAGPPRPVLDKSLLSTSFQEACMICTYGLTYLRTLFFRVARGAAPVLVVVYV